MSKEALPDHQLTEKARADRRSDRCRAEYDIGFAELAALIAVIARFRCGEKRTTRADIRRMLVEEEGLPEVPGFRVLERKRLLRRVTGYSQQAIWKPSPLALQKFSWVGTGEARESAAAE